MRAWAAQFSATCQNDVVGRVQPRRELVRNNAVPVCERHTHAGDSREHEQRPGVELALGRTGKQVLLNENKTNLKKKVYLCNGIGSVEQILQILACFE